MYQHILVATDNSEPATAAVDQACTLAGTVGAELSAISVVDTMAYGVADVRSEVGLDAMRSAAQSAVDAVASTATEAGIEVSTAVLSGSPTTVICDYVEDHDVDLIVIGTHGRRGVSRVLLGSVAERVTRTAPCSVLVVRPDNGDGE